MFHRSSTDNVEVGVDVVPVHIVPIHDTSAMVAGTCGTAGMGAGSGIFSEERL